MSILTSILLKVTQGSLNIKISIFLMVGLIALSPLLRNKNRTLQTIRQSDWLIEQADEQGSLIIQKTDIVRERNEQRVTIVKEVVAGKLSKESAAEQFMRLNRTDVTIRDMLRAVYSTSNDLECAMKQLEQYLKMYKASAKVGPSPGYSMVNDRQVMYRGIPGSISR